MIKPIEITPLNTSKKLYFECDKCGEFGTIFLENSMINVDYKDNSLEPLNDYDCPKCNENLL
ncbi:MAG: hypothetical protein JJE53_02465 [Candidatus Pacebacteria bacterium]|jgi:predicted RNA-binding Zn-ribbon protein involved in translation (DUF1610 family)|nr:hypothetical protein [Candidatus Paceibacterota bacterium]